MSQFRCINAHSVLSGKSRASENCCGALGNAFLIFGPFCAARIAFVRNIAVWPKLLEMSGDEGDAPLDRGQRAYLASLRTCKLHNIPRKGWREIIPLSCRRGFEFSLHVRICGLWITPPALSVISGLKRVIRQNGEILSPRRYIWGKEFPGLYLVISTRWRRIYCLFRTPIKFWRGVIGKLHFGKSGFDSSLRMALWGGSLWGSWGNFGDRFEMIFVAWYHLLEIISRFFYI